MTLREELLSWAMPKPACGPGMVTARDMQTLLMRIDYAAPGPDGIPTGVYTYVVDQAAPLLHELDVDCLENQSWPPKFNNAFYGIC